jgi:hemin uptake protein HemP
VAAPPTETPCSPPAAAPAASGGLAFSSRDLFRARREILIVHGHEVYRLRITRADKLILTK